MTCFKRMPLAAMLKTDDMRQGWRQRDQVEGHQNMSLGNNGGLDWAISSLEGKKWLDILKEKSIEIADRQNMGCEKNYMCIYWALCKIFSRQYH